MPLQAWSELGQAFVTFGQHLKDMPRTISHDAENLLKDFERHLFMEGIAHRGTEDHGWFAPGLRLIKAIAMNGEVESVRKRFRETVRYRFGVTILATCRHRVATGAPVPASVSPGDGCFLHRN